MCLPCEEYFLPWLMELQELVLIYILKTNMGADFPSLEKIHSSCINEPQKL